MSRLRIPGRGVVSIEGSHSVKFLQSLCTNDVAGWDRASPMATAFLSTKGRVLADSILYPGENDDQILLDLAAAQQKTLIKHLKMYKLRSAVSIRDATELCVISSSETRFDPRATALGYRDIVPRTPDMEEDSEYTQRRLALGIGEGADLSNAIPLQCNLDLLGHISFQKGCYLGQELTARSFYRGTVRKRLLPIAVSLPSDESILRAPSLNFDKNTISLPPPGTKLKRFNFNDDRDAIVGDIVASDGPIGLALLKLDFALGNSSVDASVLLEDEENDSSLVVRPYLPEWWPADLTSPPTEK